MPCSIALANGTAGDADGSGHALCEVGFLMRVGSRAQEACTVGWYYVDGEAVELARWRSGGGRVNRGGWIRGGLWLCR